VGNISEGLAVRALNPNIRVAPDVSTVDDVNEHYTAYQPEWMEFPWQVTDVEPIAAAVELGVRCTQDALGLADAAAQIKYEAGEPHCAPFAAFWERGIRSIQTDAHLLLIPCVRARNAAHGYVHTPVLQPAD
jgi:hypothetical protein